MIHLLDKLAPGQLALLALVAIIGGYITICTVARYVSFAIAGRRTEHAEIAEPEKTVVLDRPAEEK